MRFKVNMNKASQGIHLLSHNVAATMGLMKLMEEIGASEQISESFPNGVGEVEIKPIRITFRERALPYSVMTARIMSVSMLPKVKKELDHMANCGVIQQFQSQLSDVLQ